MRPRVARFWLAAMLSNVLSSMASTNPSPSVFSTARSARIFSESGSCSCASAQVDRSLTIERPMMVLAPWLIGIVGFTNAPVVGSRCPARISVIWLGPPVTGLRWQSAQELALNTGPSPSSMPLRRSKRVWSRANVSPGGSAIPLLTLCEPGFCPRVGVLKPAGASDACCCAIPITVTARIARKPKKRTLCCLIELLLQLGFWGLFQTEGGSHETRLLAADESLHVRK